MNPLLKDIFALAAECVKLSTEKHLTFATAESCTGGLIGGAITAISGSSTAFKGGVIAYDNAVKMSLLGVSDDTLSSVGAVSEETAIQMAKGAVDALNVNMAVSVTGIAGPGGGSELKPVGTVWIGFATASHAHATKFSYGDIGRNRVRDKTVLGALTILRGRLFEA